MFCGNTRARSFNPTCGCTAAPFLATTPTLLLLLDLRHPASRASVAPSPFVTCAPWQGGVSFCVVCLCKFPIHHQVLHSDSPRSLAAFGSVLNNQVSTDSPHSIHIPSKCWTNSRTGRNSWTNSRSEHLSSCQRWMNSRTGTLFGSSWFIRTKF